MFFLLLLRFVMFEISLRVTTSSASYSRLGEHFYFDMKNLTSPSKTLAEELRKSAERRENCELVFSRDIYVLPQKEGC